MSRRIVVPLAALLLAPPRHGLLHAGLQGGRRKAEPLLAVAAGLTRFVLVSALGLAVLVMASSDLTSFPPIRVSDRTLSAKAVSTARTVPSWS